MKTKFIIILFLLIAFISFFGFNLQLMAKNENPVSFANYPLSFVASDSLKSKTDEVSLQIIDNLSVKMKNINKYEVYEPVDQIKFSGVFQVKDSFFNLSVYNSSGYVDIVAWIKEKYPPYRFNEDDFSTKFSINNLKKLNNTVYQLTTKVSNGYFTSYIYKYHENFIILSFQAGYYGDQDLELILDTLQGISNFSNRNPNELKDELHLVKSRIEDFFGKKKFHVSLSLSRIKAESTYYLPWKKGDSYQVTQDWGANDSVPCTAENAADLGCSHYGVNGYSYDFGLPEDTDVLASASGTVAYIHSGETVCGNFDYIGNANYVVINHSDGKSTNYYHLNTVSVNVNDNIETGTVIGKSGKTGYSYCQAHLHYQKQAQGAAYTQSEPLYFAEYPDAPSGELQYPGVYTSQNELTINGNLCSGIGTLTITGSKTNYNCGVNSGGTVLVAPSANITPETHIYTL